MDTEVLVESRIEDGELLIRQLIREQFGVEVAFWARRNEDSLWQLWIASSSIDPMSLGESLGKVYASLAKIPACSVLPTEIKLITGTDPIAREAALLRDRNPSRNPKRYHGKRLGKLTTEELVVYPRRFPWNLRQSDGTWQVLISERDDVWLDCDAEDEARAIAAAPVLEYEALAQVKTGFQFADDLEKTADAMRKYRMVSFSRFKGWAHEVRKQAEALSD
jgi:hypothetical protein